MMIDKVIITLIGSLSFCSLAVRPLIPQSVDPRDAIYHDASRNPTWHGPQSTSSRIIE